MEGRASIRLQALGGAVELTAPGDRGAEVRAVFGTLLASAPSTPAFRSVDLLPTDGSDRAFHDELSGVVSRLNLAVTVGAPAGLMLHAGAASLRDGSTVVLCGESGSGKSTLTAGLLRRGWFYVTDEIAWIDPVSVELSTYRKPLSLKTGSHGIFPDLAPRAGRGGVVRGVANWSVAVDRLERATRPAAALRPVALVFPTYRSGGGTSLEPVGQADAAWRMGTQSSRLRDLAEPAVDVLARVARRVPAWRLVHDDQERALDVVTELVA